MAALDVRVELERAWTRSADLLTQHYQEISVFSTSWIGEDIGGNEDSNLFINTTKVLPVVLDWATTFQIPIEGASIAFMKGRIIAFERLSGISSRTLLIVHYVGYAEVGSTSDSLVLVRQVGDADPESKAKVDVSKVLLFNPIKQLMKFLSSGKNGFDLSYVMDCCCSVLGGRGQKK